MKIQRTDNTNFTHLIKTENLIKIMIESPSKGGNYEAYKSIVDTLSPNHGFVGHLGYKGQALLILKRVAAKYPSIAQDTESIKSIISKNPDWESNDIAKLTKPYIEKYGEVIDIEV